MSAVICEETPLYFPFAKGLSYEEAAQYSGMIPGSVFGRYKIPPLQPDIITGTWTGIDGVVRPRTSDFRTFDPKWLSHRIWAVYYPLPLTSNFAGLLYYFENALTPFRNRREVVLQYVTTDKALRGVEYITSSGLVQADLSLYFDDCELKYRTAILSGRPGQVEWWQ